jgi:hypothetical protein
MIVFVPVMFWATALLACLAYVISGDARQYRARTRRPGRTALPDLREAALREYPEFGEAGKQEPPAAAPENSGCRYCGKPVLARDLCRPCYRQYTITSTRINAIARRPR